MKRLITGIMAGLAVVGNFSALPAQAEEYKSYADGVTVDFRADTALPHIAYVSTPNYVGSLYASNLGDGIDKVGYYIGLINKYDDSACFGRAYIHWGPISNIKFVVHYDETIPGYRKCIKAGKTETFRLNPVSYDY